jgi:hypothetical protein
MKIARQPRAPRIGGKIIMGSERSSGRSRSPSLSSASPSSHPVKKEMKMKKETKIAGRTGTPHFELQTRG